MTPREKDAVVLFLSISHAMRAEAVVKQAGIAGKLIPIPRHLSSDCGVCLRIPVHEQERVNELLKAVLTDYTIVPL